MSFSEILAEASNNKILEISAQNIEEVSGNSLFSTLISKMKELIDNIDIY